MDKNKLLKYVNSGKSSYEIAKLENKSPTSIRYWLKKYEIKTTHADIAPLSKEEKEKRKREACLAYYYKNRIKCQDCGKSIAKRNNKKPSKRCKNCYADFRRLTGKKTTYKMIKAPDDHIGRVNKNGWIEEHRYLAQKALNRELAQNEIVHHIDGNATNNHLNNLCVLDWQLHSRYHTTCANNNIQINKQSLLDFVKNCVIFFDFEPNIA